MNSKTITIDRQYGSGGREIGTMLSKRLGIPFYNGELILIAAEEYGLNPGVMKNLDEKPSGSLIYTLAMAVEGYRNVDKAILPYKIVQAERETIKKLYYEHGPCIFIGRGADQALKDVCDFRNVFIYASSMEDRIRRANEIYGIPLEKIEAHIKRKDKQRRDHYNFHTQAEWGQMDNYDMCLNSSKLGIEGCVETIIQSLSV